MLQLAAATEADHTALHLKVLHNIESLAKHFTTHASFTVLVVQTQPCPADASFNDWIILLIAHVQSGRLEFMCWSRQLLAFVGPTYVPTKISKSTVSLGSSKVQKPTGLERIHLGNLRLCDAG